MDGGCTTVAYLEDLSCLGTALVELLGGEVDFNDNGWY